MNLLGTFQPRLVAIPIKQFLLAHGLNIFKWVVAGGIFPKDEVEQQQLMYFKNKVFTILTSLKHY
jgi:hypothetical protein